MAIAVVGGGCSGALAAARLVGHPSPIERAVVLVEPRSAVGRGAAYSTCTPSHLLNVPAGRMSAFAEDPGHFARWLIARDPTCTERTFAPRRLFGEYLRDVVDDAVARRGDHVDFTRVVASARTVQHCAGTPTAVVELDDHSAFRAERVVLTLGNLPPADVFPVPEMLRTQGRYVGDPWVPGALDAIPPDDEVMLVGTGLTAVDILMALRAQGHRGRVRAISRHGLLPMAHRQGPPPYGAAVDVRRVLAARTLGTMVRAFREAVDAVERRGGDVRDVVDALRPHTDDLWQALSVEDRRRFLARWSRQWDVARHRMAPAAATAVDGELDAGSFVVERGGIAAIEAGCYGAVVRTRTAGATSFRRVGRIVNCTGPRADLVRAGHPVIDALVVQGAARGGPLGMGLDVDAAGAVVDAAGRTDGVLWAVGPLRRGRQWETTAVGEIRGQAQAIAESVLGGAARCQRLAVPSQCDPPVKTASGPPTISPVHEAFVSTPATHSLSV